jgi:tetratricopeptide (TPR) repeat protein
VQRWPPSATWPLPSVVYLHRAESYAQLHKLPEALADADRVVASNKDQNWAYEFRARLHWSMGQYQKVVDDCTESIRLAPMATSSYVQRAKAYEKLGKSKLAARDRQKINELARTVDQ